MDKILSIIICIFTALSLNIDGLQAHQKTAVKREYLVLKHGAHRIGKRIDPYMATCRDYGLGQFIHWSVYPILGGQWNREAYPEAAEWIRSWKGMPKEVYDTLYKQFNPKDFNARQWARQSKHMGVKCVIISTKHHDWFCFWSSNYTAYTVANSPYKKDIIGQLVKAYYIEGIDVYLYFSIINWNHSGYRSVLKTEEDRNAYEGLKTFTQNQLFELLKVYPTTKGMWFDGTWDSAWKEQAAFADFLEMKLKKMVPTLVIEARYRHNEFGKRGFDSNGNLIGDYEQGRERKIPKTIADIHGNNWECVMTVPENQWGYLVNWQGHIKTSNEFIEMLSKAVSLDGNFLLNFDPDGQGPIRLEENQFTKGIGDWMQINNKAIYGYG